MQKSKHTKTANVKIRKTVTQIGTYISTNVRQAKFSPEQNTNIKKRQVPKTEKTDEISK